MPDRCEQCGRLVLERAVQVDYDDLQAFWAIYCDCPTGSGD